MQTKMQNPYLNATHWINAAFLSRCAGIEVTIHPVNTETEKPCFGITVDNQWIIGTDGTLTVFDSPDAARRFLRLLGFQQAHWRRNGVSPAAPTNLDRQLFRLRCLRLRSESESSWPQSMALAHGSPPGSPEEWSRNASDVTASLSVAGHQTM